MTGQSQNNDLHCVKHRTNQACMCYIRQICVRKFRHSIYTEIKHVLQHSIDGLS